METKAEIRKRILKQRNALSREEACAKSMLIFSGLCKLSKYQNAKTVLAYMDYKNEVMTCEFIKKCRCDGKRVVLPKVDADALLLYKINDVETDTLPGFKGIPEPNCAILNGIDPEEIDLAVIPGVAFDYNKHRVGYGAGYYDRFLSRLRPDCFKAGVAYSLQMVDVIPAGMYDIPMDIVVTEDIIY